MPTDTSSTPTSVGTAWVGSCTATRVPNDGANRAAAIRSAPVSWSRSNPGSCRPRTRLITDPDDWTLRSADGSRGAHAEHTIRRHGERSIILTDRSGWASTDRVISVRRRSSPPPNATEGRPLRPRGGSGCGGEDGLCGGPASQAAGS